jgi:arylsulfatase A-like enzyme
VKHIAWLSLAGLLLAPAALHAAEAERPNILWISCEDTSPWLGFCGEKYATTPNLDALAHGGVYYRNAYATAPVCAPSRFAIITGCYATSYGTQRLRSHFPVPETIKGFPTYLRQAGYYCCNNVKTDYNTSAEKRIIEEAWDDCGGKAHYKGRKPGQPFFAVFNLTETHQGQAFESTPPKFEPGDRHDPATAPIPPYYPDTPTAHHTMARVHDCITAMDQHVGRLLKELAEAGLRDNTIIVFWPDHGQGIPRGKRTLWDTGLKIPLVVWLPEKYRGLAPAAPGGTCDRLVSLMDLGPTMLSILGLPIPPHMQGRAFLGPAAGAPRDYIFGARDRVDEVNEVSRSVRDARFLYIHNFMPNLSWAQPETYSDQLELRREITRLAAAGKLNAAQLTYAGPRKAVEELYDTDKDPWQITNLATDPAHKQDLERLRKALRDWQLETRDLGMLHETQAGKFCERSGKSLIETMSDTNRFSLERVFDTAWRVGLPDQTAEFAKRLTTSGPTVKYWAAIGLRVAGHDAAGMAKDALQKALADEALAVRIEAAGILVAQFEDRAALDQIAAVLTSDDENAQVHAARTLQMLGEKARPALPALQAALPKIKNMFARWGVQNAIFGLTGAENTIFQQKAKGGGNKQKAAKRKQTGSTQL